MKNTTRFSLIAIVALLSLPSSASLQEQQTNMTFFVTSVGASKSWNSSHPSRGKGGGCGQEALRSSGGNGLFYCFAVN